MFTPVCLRLLHADTDINRCSTATSRRSCFRRAVPADYETVMKRARLRYVDCIAERVKRILAAIGLIGATIAVCLLVSRPARRSSPQGLSSEECEVSECGPDGTPLSLYAG